MIERQSEPPHLLCSVGASVFREALATSTFKVLGLIVSPPEHNRRYDACRSVKIGVSTILVYCVHYTYTVKHHFVVCVLVLSFLIFKMLFSLCSWTIQMSPRSLSNEDCLFTLRVDVLWWRRKRKQPTTFILKSPSHHKCLQVPNQKASFFKHFILSL